jgi:hypothetical protein
VIDGTTHLKLLIDSGASVVTLPEEIGSPFIKNLCFANGVCFETLIAATAHSPYTIAAVPGAINGLIGFNLLAALPVTIDYENRQLVFGRKAPANAIRVPVNTRPGDARPFGTAQIGGRTVNGILFDTGSSYVRLKSGLIDKLGDRARPAGGEVAFSMKKRENSRLYAVSKMCLGETACVAGELAQRGVWQAVGATFFRHFRVTIEAEDGVFALEPYASPPEFISARNKWGFQIALEDAAQIVQVDAGSVAATSGVSTTDKLVAIDGRNIASLGYLGAHALLEAKGRSAVQLGLERGGESRQVILDRP